MREREGEKRWWWWGGGVGVVRASVLCKYEVADVWSQIIKWEQWRCGVARGWGGGARARLYGENVNPEQ